MVIECKRSINIDSLIINDTIRNSVRDNFMVEMNVNIKRFINDSQHFISNYF
jgi:hypothetical protein